MGYHYSGLFQHSLKNIIQVEKIIGQNIDNESFDRQLLWLSIRRFISHAKAIFILCDKKQNLEALMLLRPIIELVVTLRWIVEDNTGKNREQFMKSIEYKFNDDGIPVLGGYWTEKTLKTRMKDIGFDAKYYDSVIKKLHEELHVNPSVIARAHNKNLSAMSNKAIFSIGYQWLGHLLKVVNDLYPNQKEFMHCRDVWSKIRIK